MAIPLGGVAASLGSALGTGLSEPIEQGLQRLSQQKMYELQNRYAMAAQEQERQRLSSALEPYVGAQTSQFLANLSPKERERAFQNLGALMQLQPQHQQGLGMQALAHPQGVPQYQQAPQRQGTANLLRDLFTSPHEKREDEKLRLRQQQLDQQRELAERKMQLLGEQQTEKLAATAREFSEPYIKKAEAAEKNIRDYNALIKLAQTGKLRAGTSNIILKGLGIDKLGQNYETQLAEKLIGRLAQNAPAVFGTGRFTNYMEQTFQRSIPALTNTKEGIIALSKINLLADKAELIKNKVRAEIIKENNGRLPFDLADQINERSRPQIEELENEGFKILNPFAPTQNIEGAGLNEGPFTLTPMEGEQESGLASEIASGLGRFAGRSVARPLESIAGLPHTAAAINDLIVNAPANIGNLVSNALVGKKPFPTFNIAPYIPSSDKIREYVTKGLTGQLLEPRNEAERIGDEIMTDVISLALPIGNKMSALKTIGLPVVGNLAKWAAKEMTGSPVAGEAAKIGSMMTFGLLGTKKAMRAFESDSYKAAESAIPANASFNVQPEFREIAKMADKVAASDMPDKKFLMDRFEAFDKIIANPEKANIKNLIDLKKDWNKHIYETDLTKNTKRILSNANNELKNAIKRYAGKNPAFKEPYTIAEDLHAAVNTQSYLEKLIDSHPDIKKHLSHKMVERLIVGASGILGGLHKGVLGAAAYPAAAYGLDIGVKNATMLAKSPAARRFYASAVNNILTKNWSQAARNLDALTKEAEKYE